MRGTVMNVVEGLPAEATPRQIIRAVRSRMRESVRRGPRGSRARKAAYRLALEHHAYWRQLTGAKA